MKEPLLVVLDIDETLIHSDESTQPSTQGDFSIEGYNVYERPFLKVFLNTVFSKYKVAFFTSATSDYADAILKQILTIEQQNNTQFVFARERCTFKVSSNSYGIYSSGGSQQFIYKELKKVFKLGFDKNRVVVVDDKPHSFKSAYSNCVPIKIFNPIVNPNSHLDKELLKLLYYLDVLDDAKSVRSLDHRLWETVS